jgi:hypothetical protein
VLGPCEPFTIPIQVHLRGRRALWVDDSARASSILR